jgi:hypothetical protein
MFTLPVDLLLPVVQTPQGKTTQTSYWNLSVTVQPGVMKNQQDWVPGQDHPHFHDHDIRVEVWVGKECLLSTRLNNQQIFFSKNLPDSDIPTRQDLTVKLFGKPDNPDLETDDHVVVKINVEIENLSVRPVFETQGYYQIESTKEKKIAGVFLGENGSQTLQIYLPIYVWLLQNQNLLH